LLRLSVNLLGAPAMKLPEFRSYQQDLIVGAGLQVSVPAGQYDETRLVNIGTNRALPVDSYNSIELSPAAACRRAPATASIARDRVAVPLRRRIVTGEPKPRTLRGDSCRRRRSTCGAGGYGKLRPG
jgi:hypothetical protein